MAATIELVAESWRSRGWQVSVRPTQAAGHATELAAEAADDGQRLVLAAGGDGTLGEVANGLAGSETAMGPLPVGTANSFAQELHMPRPGLMGKEKLFQASDALAAGCVYRMDLGFTERNQGPGRYWLLWAGTGADGYLVNQLEPRPKWSKKLGRVGYITQSLLLAPGLPRMHASVQVDGQTFEGEFLLVVVTNCRRYAGGELLLSPQARLDDGLFEVWMFRGRGMSHALRYFLQVKLQRHGADRDIIMVRGRKVTVETEPRMPCQTDGERAGSSPLCCEIRPGVLRLLVPDTAPADLFAQSGLDLR